MGTVRDPNFWRRFSIAVHQDEMEKEEVAKRPDLKHSYVSTSNNIDPHDAPPSPITTPTSLSHLSPAFPPPACTSSPLSPISLHQVRPHSEGLSQPNSPTSISNIKLPSPTSPKSNKLQKGQPGALPQEDEKDTIKPRSPRRPSVAHTTRSGFFGRHGNASQLTLGFSGRPPSRFKFWTSITADPSNRDSWLESQRKKRRQRTWMCWVFWICFLLLVAGVVVAILLLKHYKII